MVNVGFFFRDNGKKIASSHFFLKKKAKKTNKSYKIEGINHKKHVKLTSK